MVLRRVQKSGRLRRQEMLWRLKMHRAVEK